MTPSRQPLPIRAADVDAFLPLRPADHLILLSLVESELHGYGILQAVAASSDDLVRLDTGNLYRTLKKLMDEGLVDRREVAAGEDDDPRRRYYRLTPLGHRVVSAETARLRALLERPAARALAGVADPESGR